MFSDGWTWHPLDAKAFKVLLKNRGVISIGSDQTRSCSLFTCEEGRITLGFVAGTTGNVTALGKYLRTLAAKRGEKVRALIPKGTSFVSALEKAGFEKAGTILVYERQLKAKVSKP